MRQSTRLIINSGSTFVRMAFAVVIGLLVTRLLVQYLGKVDFGLIMALGATGAMLQFITGALTSGVQRQFAYEIGQGAPERLNRAFSTAWLVYLVLGMVLWLIGLALTPLIMHGLTIPADRINAAWWVYQISLLNVLLAVTATPYQALIVAHQHLTVSAVADSFIALSRLVAVLLLLLVVRWDWMVSFVAFQLAGYAVVRWAVNIYCLWRYPESWPRPRNFDRTQLREITNIAIWTLLNQLSVRFRVQGGILLLNIYFGPIVNAAYGIAVQVSDYALNIAQTLRLSVMPAIVGAHAKGNRQNVHRLALVAGKYTVLLAATIFVPVWLEVNQLLYIWLGEVPQYSVVFVRLIIIWTLLSVFPLGYHLALLASGNIGWFTRQNVLIAAITLIVSGIGFHFGLGPWFLPGATALGMSALMMICVFGIGPRIGLAPATWFFEALLPTLGVLAPGIVAASAVYISLPEGVLRMLAVAGTYWAVATPLVWWVALSDWERHRFIRFAASVITRIQHASNARSRP